MLKLKIDFTFLVLVPLLGPTLKKLHTHSNF